MHVTCGNTCKVNYLYVDIDDVVDDKMKRLNSGFEPSGKS